MFNREVFVEMYRHYLIYKKVNEYICYCEELLPFIGDNIKRKEVARNNSLIKLKKDIKRGIIK